MFIPQCDQVGDFSQSAWDETGDPSDFLFAQKQMSGPHRTLPDFRQAGNQRFGPAIRRDNLKVREEFAFPIWFGFFRSSVFRIYFPFLIYNIIRLAFYQIFFLNLKSYFRSAAVFLSDKLRTLPFGPEMKGRRNASGSGGGFQERRTVFAERNGRFRIFDALGG